MMMYHVKGIALILSMEARKSLNEWKPISEQIISFFVGLSPSARKPKSMHQPMRLKRNSRKTFTNSFKLPSTKKEVQETLILVISSIDTKVGSDNRNWEASMETHGEGVINEKGKMFRDFCATNLLVIGGTLSPTRDPTNSPLRTRLTMWLYTKHRGGHCRTLG